MASGVRRGSDGKAAFEVHKDRHATNVEVLTDVAVLSSADALVHGASAARQENQLGYTALHFAASQARAALVGLLVQHGADGTPPHPTRRAGESL